MNGATVQKSPWFSWMNRFRSGDLCLTGLLMAAAFLGNPSALLRTVQLLLFWLYAGLMGKRNKPLITLLVMAGIVFFNLLVPYGKVLLTLGPFPITQGSLLGGLHKALTLEGLIMLSKASVKPDLRLPGAFGSLLGASFRVFEGISERKRLIAGKSLIQGIDALMLALSAEQEGQEPTPRAEPPRTLRAFLLLGGAALPILALTALGLYGNR